jgi:heptosyltransferase-2
MHFTKTYPARQYAELIQKFDGENFSFLLTGRGNDKRIIEEILSVTGKNVYDLCDKLNIHELKEIMKLSDLVICGDTGPMHIAEGLNKPLMMLAGSSVKEFGFYPQNKKTVVLENNNLTCRPCSHIGRNNCPKVHFKCMIGITPDEVFNTAKKLLN